MPLPTRRVLLVQPRFSPNSFWNYQETCQAVGARYSAAPLGIITVAALLPPYWQVRLADRNVEELTPEALDWADLVMVSAMLPQQFDAKKVIALAHARGKRVVMGGPDATCSPEAYAEADFLVLGEAEEIMADLVAAVEAGAEKGRFEAKAFPDIKKSPVPRFDLLKLDRYIMVGVQLNRGCPFNCEFCNVIDLNGRSPRTKSTPQMLRELDALLATGYRGHVDFVDDNMIGNRRALKPFLVELASWVKEHGYPFEFSTEASLNLADDPELLSLLKAANFVAAFVGIETPDPVALAKANKKQNLGRDIAESVRKINAAGIFVNAGFIVGFDTEGARVDEAMVDCIERSAIPVCMVGLLYALPGTQLANRLKAEGRLYGEGVMLQESDADQCTSGLNFATRRPRREIFEDFRSVYRRIYNPAAYFGRVKRTVRSLDMRGHKLKSPVRHILRDLRSFGRIAWRNGFLDRETAPHFWSTFADCLLHNPRAIKIAGTMAALYLHIRPFMRLLDERIEARLEEPEPEASAPVSRALP